MSSQRPAKKSKHGIFEFLLGGLVCVGVPAFMTASAPVSWLAFQRDEGRVTAKVQTCLFFVIPYREHELVDVKRIETTFRRGEDLHKRRGDRKEGRAEDQAALVLHGPQEEQAVTVPVSPASIDTVKTKVQSFLDAPNEQRLSLFTIANWKVGMIFAIPLCLLTVLFVVGWAIWFGNTLAKPFQFARRDAPPKQNSDIDQTEQPA